MKHRLLSFVLLLVMTAIGAQSCAKVAISGRNQLDLIPDSEMQAMSEQQYRQFLAENQLSSDAEATAMVRRCGARIQSSVERYFLEKGMPNALEGYAWEFNLVESEQVNAWCMPGGKVMFYSAILPICADEAGVAVVMGHEVAHAVAKHGDERMSQALLAQLGVAALGSAMGKDPSLTGQLFLQAFGIGSQVGMLAFGRNQESEADHLGLVFMAMAGYDPHNAVNFWQRLASQKSGGAPPEILSTHPADARRIRDIEAHMDEAMTYYRPASSSLEE